MRRLYQIVLPLLVAAMFVAGCVTSEDGDRPEDFQEATTPDTTGLEALRRDARAGDADAQSMLLLEYIFLGVRGFFEKDYDEAMRWYRKAAEQGDASAKNYLGDMYANGHGVAQDYGEAIRWYRESAERGNATGQLTLGNMYFGGEGVAQDYAESAQWYRKSAEAGMASAQFNLGMLYNNGWGVPQVYHEAVRWYRRAAEQGNTRAQFNLGLSYRNGRGMPEDLIKAHKWYNLAGSQGHTEAWEYRREVEGNMTREEIAEAQELARDWSPESEPVFVPLAF